MTCIVRPLLSRHNQCIFLWRSLTSLDVSSFNHHPISVFIRSQMHSNLRSIIIQSQFRTPSLLGITDKNKEFKTISNLRRLSSIPPRQDLEHEDEKESKKITLKQNPLRKDRQASVQFFQNILQAKGDNVWTADDWMQLAEQLSSQMSGLWEVMCMHTLMVRGNVDIARSLMKYLEAEPKPPSRIITTFYIGLLGKTCSGNQEQELEMKKYYDDLVSGTDVFDAASIEVLVEGLSNTKFYKECVNLLELCKLTSKPGDSLLRNILMGALRNDDMELCSLILQHYEEDIGPSQLIQCATEVIDVAINSKNQEGLQKVLDFMQKHRLSLVRSQLETVMETFKRNDPGQWKGAFGFVNYKSGQCSICRHQLPRIHISEEEFKAVQAAFLDQVIISDNIFYKTSPEEVRNFIKFIEKFGPFDVVIDGLNALHANHTKPDKLKLQRLMSHFCDRDKRVLVLGSKVLRSYVQSFKGYKPKPAIYVTSTRADDAFFLYAALHSGKNAIIVSADKLRDHKFRLEPQLRHIFHRWLASIQVFNFVNPRTGIINPKRHVFSLGPEKDEHGWHIPVNDIDMKYSFGRQGILCLRHGPENFTQTNDRPVKPKYVKPKRTQSSSLNKEWFDL